MYKYFFVHTPGECMDAAVLRGDLDAKGSVGRWNVVPRHEMRQSDAAEDHSHPNGSGARNFATRPTVHQHRAGPARTRGTWRTAKRDGNSGHDADEALML